MLSENPNKYTWKKELDQLSSLPGEEFNKDEAWENLHQRLAAKKSEKKIGAYWLAAAVAALFIVLFFFEKNEKAVLQSDRRMTKAGLKKQDHARAIQHTKQSTALRKDSIVQPSSLHNEVIVQAKKKQEHQDEKTTAQLIDTITAVAMSPLESILLENDSLALSIAPQPIKRKLQVIHINELDLPKDHKDRFARAEQSRPEKKMLSGGSFSSLGYTTYSDDNILKIKLSPNN